MTTNPSQGMIERLIEASARNKLLVVILIAFALLASIWSIKNIALDAIPDLSDTQVIVYSKWDRSPDVIEDQVTYPIISSLLGMPGVKAIRGFSDFGFSYVNIIFKDGTDIYWARSRTLEYLSKILPSLPEGVKTELGPDATGLGWVYQYALVDSSGQHSLQELRSFQDWQLRYHLQSVPGVAEVASLGGYVKQYQITVDPQKLLYYNIPLDEIVEHVRASNEEAGGRLLEFSGAEYMIRSHGYIKSIEDLEKIVVGRDDGQSILLKDVANVSIGPDIRRGIADFNGQGDVVTGTIVMRFGENALSVINRVKEKIQELEPSLPAGVEIKPLYDRSELILRAMETLKRQLIEEMIIVSLVILFFLWHFPSAIVAILTIPVAVLLSFIPMQQMGLTSNIMSLAGIAISIGVLVDGAIVQMENVYKRLEEWKEGGRQGRAADVCLHALKEVGPSVFFSLLVIAVSFMPIFTLLDQEGRLFKPLAWAKTYSMAIAAVLVVTLNPAIRMLFFRIDPFTFKPAFLARCMTTLFVGSYHREEDHPVSRRLFKIYEPVCRWVLHRPKTVLAVAIPLCLWAMLNLAAIFMQVKLPGTLVRGFEFMPALHEGTVLYMPTTLPGISVAEAQKLLMTQDRILKSFPEVETVFGKAGRLESSTDPAPFSMMETVIVLKPEDQWRQVNGRRISYDDLVNEMDAALQIPGTSNAWTMPIINRINMLSTGVRTPIGIKVLGEDIKTVEAIAVEVEGILKDVPGTRSAIAERAAGGYFLDFDLKRDDLARYGLTVADAQMVVLSAIGGENVTTTIEGRERYGVSVRYPRELRQDIESLEKVYVATPSGAQIPLGEIADIVVRTGPSMIRNENGLLAAYVYVDVNTTDIGSYVARAKDVVRQHLSLPQGTSLLWSGQYENMLRVKERLKVILPLTLFLISFLLYLNTKSWAKTAMVLLAVPLSVVGAVLLLWFLGYNVSIAVWVGIIALMGLDAETGILMLLFLDLSCKDAQAKNQLKTKDDLREAVVHGAVKRLRPKMMTVAAAFMGLLPIMWSMTTGADVMKRIAAPMVGGLASSFILELLIYPVIYFLWKWNQLKHQPVK